MERRLMENSRDVDGRSSEGAIFQPGGRVRALHSCLKLSRSHSRLVARGIHLEKSKSEIAEIPTLRGGLRVRITGAVLLAALGTALAVGSAGVYAVYAPLRETIEQTYSRVLAGSAEEVVEILDTARIDIGSLAEQPWLRMAILGAAARSEQTGPDPLSLVEALEQAHARAPGFIGLVARDRSGETLGFAGTGPLVESLLERLRSRELLDSELLDRMQAKQLQKQLGGDVAPRVRTVDTGGVLRMVIAASPVLDEDGDAAATILGLLSQSELNQQLQADLLGDDANILLVDEIGGLVAAHRSSEAPISVTSDQADACSLRFTWSADRGGVVTCALPLGSLGWALVAEQSAEKVFQPLFIMLPALLTTGAIMVLAFTLLAAKLASATVRPVHVLYRGMISVARGDLSVQIPENRAPGEMDSLIAAFNYMVRQSGERSRLVEDSQRALEKQNLSVHDKFQSVSELSVTDPLTQLHNRRFFDHQLQCEAKRLNRKGEGFCLLLIDIDDFKKINDTFGHAAGDEFLKQIAKILKENVRATDLLARFGGEEFVVVATVTDIEGATVVAEKMRTAVAEASFIVDESMRPRRATISIGVAAYKGSQTGLFNAADAALYRAKESGKNCVVGDGGV